MAALLLGGFSSAGAKNLILVVEESCNVMLMFTSQTGVGFLYMKGQGRGHFFIPVEETVHFNSVLEM